MILFEEITRLPTPVEGKAAEAEAKSLCMWSVTYIPLHEVKGHTLLGYFGLVPVDFLSRIAYMWLMPVGQPSRKMMQEAKWAYLDFLDNLPWTTYAYTEIASKRDRRFAEFMGYTHVTQLDGYNFFKREKDGD